MPLPVDLPTDLAPGDPDHTDGHNTANTRVNAVAAEVNAHEAATTSVHGIANTAVLETTTGSTAKVTTHAGASDPHGDRAFTTTAVATHTAASDPHGDRAFTTTAIATHSADTTSVHGIADTTALATTAAVAARSTDAATYARRHANRARALTRARLAETLPGVTISAATDAGTTIASGVEVDAWDTGLAQANAVFRWVQSVPQQAGPSFPLDTTVVFDGLDSTFGVMTIAAEFAYNGDKFDLRFVGQGTEIRYRVWADDLLLGNVAGFTAVGGPLVNVLVTLPDARPRIIRIEVFRGSSFRGLVRQPSASVAYPTTRAKGPRVIVLGDSYVEGVGASASYNALAYRLGLGMGWVDTWASGSGGTGYLNVPGSPSGRKTFRGRVQTDVIDQNPDIVIVTGGLNDRIDYTAAAVGAEAELLFDEILTGLPDSELIVIGPQDPFAGAGWVPELPNIRDAVQAAAAERGLYFIDPIGEEWITPENKTSYISEDNVHPTDAGHTYLAERIVGHLRSLLAP